MAKTNLQADQTRLACALCEDVICYCAQYSARENRERLEQLKEVNRKSVLAKQSAPGTQHPVDIDRDCTDKLKAAEYARIHAEEQW